MKPVNAILSEISEENKYRFKTILFIAFLWTLTDTLVIFTLNRLPGNTNRIRPVLLRESILFLMSLIMGYLLVVALKNLFGKYVKPKTEKRIVMFIDLTDSTSIGEKFENKQYFKFIREFIYQVSDALIQYGGRIYQYVGDEIVVSWMYNTKNIKNCMKALLAAHKNLQKNSDHFRRYYGIVPEYRVGIHVGDVTVGEIGIIKKDLAMSGDTMNTTARIRSACSELNEKYIVSKDFIEHANLKSWQVESLGPVVLKGKEDEIELFSLKI